MKTPKPNHTESGKARPPLRSGIQFRLATVTTLVLIGILTLAGAILDRTFRASTLAGEQERLQLVIYSLMGAAHADALGIRVDELPEPRLSQPESGLYAAVWEPGTGREWRSPSALTTNVQRGQANAVLGEFRFSEVNAGGVPRFLLSYLVIWDDADESQLIFQVAADQAPTLATIGGFRRDLAWGLARVILLVIGAQILAIRWGLTPLRVMAEEVRALEEGRREGLSDNYPKELTGLRRNLAHFIDHEHRRRTRYRNALEDLAHSLKTPLAVIRNALGGPMAGEGQAPGERRLIAEQLDRMEGVVTHQLSRATVAGPVVVGRPVDLTRLAERLIRALKTAYADRGLAVEVRLPPSLSVRGDERDLMDLFGNLLENAFKYTRSQVRVSGEFDAGAVLRIEDDGPGVDAAIRDDILNRGARGDQVQPGQGIGLSVASELIQLYGGAFTIGDSPLGGASIEVRLPR